MCGIAGKFSLDGERPVSGELIQRMTDIIAHRGPDGEGHYVTGPIGLGHRRLSIIDLSTGAQPLCNEDRTVWIIFNGEIYNYLELRTLLLARGHVFTTQSDTEVIVHLWEEYGVECVQHLRGMFAFAIWDANRQALFLARDRVGIKPLYYAQTAHSLIFASEIKALLLDPELSQEINSKAIDRFLTYLYLPGRETMFSHVFKLEPGHYLLATRHGIERKQYWDLRYAPDERWRSLDEAAEALNALLRDTVADHMISDVPVGFLASGGVDSTALLSYAVERTDKPIQTFTVGFSGASVVDERPYARLAAKRFGTSHHEITVSAEDFRRFLPKYVWHMEEPVCEPPAIALYYVSKLARQHVTVLLSGEGGDEAFGGYPEYRNYPALEKIKKWAGPLRQLAGPTLALAGRLGGNGRLQKYAALMDGAMADYYFSRVTTPHDYFHRSRRSLYTEGFARTINGTQPTAVTRDLFSRVQDSELLNQMLYVDTKTWLPDDLLVKADKITMANSLELRVPFLDHQVLEFAAALPPDFKVHRGSTKRVVKRAFQGRVPEEVLTRRKAGFPVPYEQWLHEDLRDLVRDTVLSSTAVSRGYFSRRALEMVVDPGPHPEASSRELFSLLVLELWHQQFVDGARASHVRAHVDHAAGAATS